MEKNNGQSVSDRKQHSADSSKTIAISRTIHISEGVLRQISAKKTDHEIVCALSAKKIRSSHTAELFSVFNEKELREEPVSLDVDPSGDFLKKLQEHKKHFKIEKMIARGGFGMIFQAEDQLLNRKFVIKSLRSDLLNDPLAVKDFISEAKLCAQLDHPAIVPLYDLDSDETGGLHLSMQLIRGISLKEYIFRYRKFIQEHSCRQSLYNKLLRSRLEIFLHICNAMEYSHNRHVIHNDLKPENIVIARYGQVYVMDWGIAGFENSKSSQGVSGTPAYIAPERISDHKSTKQSDVFALGMILNELVTLRDSVKGASTEEILEKICSGKYEPTTPIDPRLKTDRALSAIIEQARHPAPGRRYPDVRSLSADIRHYLFDEEISACPDSHPKKVMRYLYRHHNLAFACLSLFILISIGFAFLGLYHEHRISQKISREMFRNSKLLNTVQLLSVNLSKRMILLQEQLRNLENTLSIEVAKHKKDSAWESRTPSFFRNEDFLPAAKRKPSGMIHTALYKHALSLNTGAFLLLNPKLKERDVLFYTERIRSLNSLLSSIILVNVPRDKNEHGRNSARLFFYRGSLIRRITCVLDNGMVHTYPGMYRAVSKREELISPYVQRELKEGNQQFWGIPELNDSGDSVISCWQILEDPLGGKYGVISFEVSFDELAKPIFLQAQKEGFKTSYTIVDSEDRLIYASESSKQQKSDRFKTSISHDFYRFPNALQQIRKHPSVPQFTMYLGGRFYRITWERIPSTKWLLIQHVPVEHTGIVDSVEEEFLRGKLREEFQTIAE